MTNVNSCVQFDITRVGNNANLCADGNACGSGRKKINGALVAAIIIPVIAVISLCILLFLLLRQKIKGKGIVRWQFSVLCTGHCLFRMKHCKAIVVFVAFFYKKIPCL
jgi:hypothetical protein